MATNDIKKELFTEKEAELYLKAYEMLEDTIEAETFNEEVELERLKKKLHAIDNQGVKSNPPVLNSGSIVEKFFSFLNASKPTFMHSNAFAMMLILSLCGSLILNSYYYLSDGNGVDEYDMAITFRGGGQNDELSLLSKKIVSNIITIAPEPDITVNRSTSDPYALINTLYISALESGLNVYLEKIDNTHLFYVIGLELSSSPQENFKRQADISTEASGIVLFIINSAQ